MVTPSRIFQAAFVTLALILFLASSVPAQAQDFMLTAGKPSPPSVEPGGSSIATILVQPLNGFTGSVALTCAITPVQTTNPPACLISPGTVTNSGSATVTFTSQGTTAPTLYTVTVTGVGPATTHTVQVNFSVLDVTPEYTLTVTAPLSPSSLHAGSGAIGTITITPLNGYNGTVWPSCSSITPTVVPAPVCTFTNSQQQGFVQITNSQVATITLTVNTSGPPPTGSIRGQRVFYALWLFLPGLALIGLNRGQALHKRLPFVLALVAIAGTLLLIPGCGTTTTNSTTSSSTSGTTPKNSYTFTLSAADDNGLAPSNSSQTATLTVN